MTFGSGGGRHPTEEEEGEEEEDEANLRCTFLVNVWVNHLPKYATRFSADAAASLAPPLTDASPFNFSEAVAEVAHQVMISLGTNFKKVSNWHFHDASRKFKVSLPLPLGLDGDFSTMHVLCPSVETRGMVEDLGACDEEDEEAEDVVAEEEVPREKKQRKA